MTNFIVISLNIMLGLVTLSLVEPTGMISGSTDEYASSMRLHADYLGCFADSFVRDLSGIFQYFERNNSIDNCAVYCWQNKFQYAGVQYGYLFLKKNFFFIIKDRFFKINIY